MKKYFITATGTNIGKTFVTAALIAQLRQERKSVTALKPVMSGFDPLLLATSDTGILLKAQGLPLSEAAADTISPWRFPEAISPDMAAKNAGKSVNFTELITFCRNHENDGFLLVEGAGGAMTPIGNSYTVLDWMAALGYKIILVTGSYLGTLSHTLTTYEAITARGLKIHSIIVNESDISPVPLSQTLSALKRFLPNNLLTYSLPRTNDGGSIKNLVL